MVCEEHVSPLLKKPAQEIEDQSQRDGDEQHRYDGNVHVEAVALVANVSRQAPEPTQST